MPTNSEIMSGAVAWMRNHVGLTEKPSGSNVVPLDGSTLWRLVRPSFEGGAWCAAACTYAYLQNGVDLRKLLGNPFYCPSLEAFAKQIGAWKTSGGNLGDLVLYDLAHQGLATHVGIAFPDPSASTYRAVEGNTSWGDQGSQSNGGVLCVRYRPRAGIRGWIDMAKVLDYARAKGAVAGAAPTAASPVARAVGAAKKVTAAVTPKATAPASPAILASGTKGAAVLRLQGELRRLFPAYAGKLVADGDFGPATKAAVAEFQRRSGLVADGEVGPATTAALRKVGARL